MESRGIIGFNRIGVLEAVAIEFNYAGCALNNILKSDRSNVLEIVPTSFEFC